MSKLKNELEELAFKALEPESYESLRAKVESKRKHAESLIDDLAARVRAKLEEAQVPVIAVDGRIKRLFSIHRKLLRQKIDLAQVYDFIALRVITASVKDCYATLGIIHQTWSPVPGRIKDFVAMPRPNGYQSLHTSVISEQGVPFEVQIRSQEMHRRAEEGIAAHWKYKEGRIGDQRDERYFQWLRQLLELQQEVRDPQEFMQNLKIDLYPEEVYVFTPKGEVRSLPHGATPVDFAYGVHTDVGHQCVAALINGKMAPLRTRLQNGDIVQINTQPAHRPSRDWLSFVVTSRARSKIKHVLQAEERTAQHRVRPAAVREGGAALRSQPEDAARERRDAGVRRRVRRAENRGSAGLRRLRQAGAAHAGAEGRAWRTAARAGARFGRGVGGQARAAHRAAPRTRSRSAASTTSWCSWRGAAIRFAASASSATSPGARACRCTRPRCRNVVNLMFAPERRIEVEWDGQADQAPYVVKLTMRVEDRKGMLAEISSKVSNINTNITNMEAHAGTDRQARIEMTVEIRDVKHLDKVIKSIKGVDGVSGRGTRTARQGAVALG